MTGRPGHVAAQAQQEYLDNLHRKIASQNLVIDYIARLAGVTNEVTAIRKAADLDNPAQPVANPPSEGPSETTEEAATPEAYDSPLAPGQTPGSVQNLPADTTGTPLDPGVTLPTAPYNDLVNVQAPVAGTETQLPLPQTRTEVDVRVGDPMNLETAFPWGGEGTGKAANRTMASMRLAKLRIQAGIAAGDELDVAAGIQADASITDQALVQEITTLGKVAAVHQAAAQRPAGVVPRAASVQRVAPSLVGQPSGGLQSAASASSVADDTADSDLFD